jgi:hypothetical protein
MQIFEQTLRKLLSQSNLVGNRVFLLRAPQSPNTSLTLPYIVFFHVAPVPHHTHRGPLKQLQRVYQVSIFDESQSRALAIADSLRAWLDTYHGLYDGVNFGSTFYLTQTSTYEADTRLFQVIQEYQIIFEPAVPTRSIKPQLTRS